MIREGDILICNEYFFKMGTGITWSFIKDRKYKIMECYPIWNGYSVQCKTSKGKFNISCGLSEEEIKKHFDYLTIQRRNKIQKIMNR